MNSSSFPSTGPDSREAPDAGCLLCPESIGPCILYGQSAELTAAACYANVRLNDRAPVRVPHAIFIRLFSSCRFRRSRRRVSGVFIVCGVRSAVGSERLKEECDTSCQWILSAWLRIYQQTSANN